MTNTYNHAERELRLLSESAKDPENRPVIEEFAPEILALAEKFGQSGQSGGSAPYVASALAAAIKKLLLFEAIAPLTGEDEEWVEHDFGGTPYYQNNRDSRVFKDHKDGKAYFIDAMIKRNKDGMTWHGWFWKSKEDYLTGDKSLMISPMGYIKEFPFIPKTFYIDVIEEEVAPDDWEMYMVNPEQLKEVYEYYDPK